MKAAQAIRDAGGRIRGVLALIDREEGGREALEMEGLDVIALTRASDIIARMET
jgi:orotate phosphoribosyltransferase